MHAATVKRERKGRKNCIGRVLNISVAFRKFWVGRRAFMS